MAMPRGRKLAKPAKKAKRATAARKAQSTAVLSARPTPRKSKTGERQADRAKSGTAKQRDQLRAAEDRQVAAQQIIAELERRLDERTTERDEALAQQTATADVLRAISRSTFDLDAVLQTLVQTAARLCNTGPATIFRRDGDVYRYAASQILEPSYREI